MDNYQFLQKIIRKGKKYSEPNTVIEHLYKQISDVYREKNARELHFLTLYYGLQDKAMTLEAIGKNQEQPLTRERVRQIIDSVLNILKTTHYNYENPYTKANSIFIEVLNGRNFIRLEELVQHDMFKEFKKNTKGLIAFFNDCGIRQVAYRKSYYFYPKNLDRKKVIASIQQDNKLLRRENTLEKMNLKSKTVTYVPDEVRQYLLEYAQKKSIHLNPLYEEILNSFMTEKPYLQPDFIFSRTKSWKARKGKAQWQQIGIYIDKDIFENIKKDVTAIKNQLGKSVSLMSFICQSFVWHYEKNKK